MDPFSQIMGGFGGLGGGDAAHSSASGYAEGSYISPVYVNARGSFWLTIGLAVVAAVILLKKVR